MIHVGLTGGIGSGKSTVAKVFETLGIPVFYADHVAKLAYTDKNIQEEVKSIFGAQVFSENQLVRQRLAEIVFSEKHKLEQLNSIIHPWVATQYQEWCKIYPNAKYVIREAAILIESGAYKTCDKIILISAPEEMRIQRVHQRDQLSNSEIQRRINNQMKDEEREKYANYNWANDNEFPLLEHILLFDNMIRA
ncbi:MAG: dephospho-CoA kinase [Flavobacteriales bacterium]